MVAVRTLSGLTLLALCLAGCGGAGDGPSAAATPQFVTPAPVESAPSAPARSVAPSPSGAPTSVSPSPSTAKPSPSATTKRTIRYAFPVRASNVSFHPTHSKYPGTDLFADCGEPVVATTSGVILEVSLKDAYVKGRPDGPLNGGLSVSLLGDDGVRYYGSHLSKVQPGIRPGVRVKSGQRLGAVGRTGNANNVCHLHYGISPPCARTGDWKVRRGVVWPADYLTSWRNGGNKSPAAKVAAWERKNDCEA